MASLAGAVLPFFNSVASVMKSGSDTKALAALIWRLAVSGPKPMVRVTCCQTARVTPLDEGWSVAAGVTTPRTVKLASSLSAAIGSVPSGTSPW